MKEERILNVLGQVDDKYIKEATPTKKVSRRTDLRKWGSLVACLALIVAVCFSMFSPNGNMVVSAYAYGTEEELTAAGAITSTGTISDAGEVTGHPLMFFLAGEDIVTVRYSCKNQMINFIDLTEKRDEFGNAQNFIVPYGENENEYHFLLIDWVPNDTIQELTYNENSTIETLPKELKEDVIVMEITFANGRTTTKAINISLQNDGTFFATYGDYRIKEEDSFVSRPDSETIPRDILYGNTEITIAFLDGENNEVPAEALWYNMAHVDRILVKWTGATPETVQVYYTPSGTETIDQVELLCTKAIWVNNGEIVFSTEELSFAEMKYVQGHLQIDLGFSETKASSEIYNVFYDPTIPYILD